VAEVADPVTRSLRDPLHFRVHTTIARAFAEAALTAGDPHAEKLAEVLGLAQAAQGVTEKVEGLVDDEGIAAKLQKQRQEAEETERRCVEIAEQRDGKKTAVLEKAAETKAEATEMMKTYLGDDADGLDGFEFLIMAEAGEVGHWGVLAKLNESAGEDGIAELVEWAKPIQERHFEEARECSLTLAGEEDPYEES